MGIPPNTGPKLQCYCYEFENHKIITEAILRVRVTISYCSHSYLNCNLGPVFGGVPKDDCAHSVSWDNIDGYNRAYF